MSELDFFIVLSAGLFFLAIYYGYKLIDANYKIGMLKIDLETERKYKDEYLVGWTASNNRIGAAIKLLKGGEK